VFENNIDSIPLNQNIKFIFVTLEVSRSGTVLKLVVSANIDSIFSTQLVSPGASTETRFVFHTNAHERSCHSTSQSDSTRIS